MLQLSLCLVSHVLLMKPSSPQYNNIVSVQAADAYMARENTKLSRSILKEIEIIGKEFKSTV